MCKRLDISSLVVSQAQVVDVRREAEEAAAGKAVLERELHNMLMQLHAAQLQLQASKGLEPDSHAIKKKLVCRIYTYMYIPLHH